MSDIHALEPEELMAYLDGELPAARAAEAIAHLDRCAHCQELAADLRRVSHEMTAWQVDPPLELAAPVERTESAFHFPFRIPTFALAAGGSIVAIGLFFFASRATRQQMRPVVFSTDGQLVTDQVEGGARLRASALPAAAPALPATPATPMIERTAALNLTARDFDPLRSRLDSILARHHGYLAELTLSAPQSSGRSLSATLRLPAAELDSALSDLRQLGRVDTETQKGEDVTRAYADLVARLANSRATEQRLTQLLAQRTGKLSDVLDFEREISRVRGEIEQMEAERRTTADQVAFATVQFNASESYQAQLRLSPESTLTRLRNAAVDGYKNLAGGLVAVALVLIAYGPSVLLWAALAFFLIRWLLRRKVAQASRPAPGS